MADPITVESRPAGESTSAELVPVQATPPAIVRAAAPLSEIQDAARSYHELYHKILDASDFQNIQGKKFVKKSGWRKLALAFNVTFTIVSKDYERDERGRIVRAEIVARATAPNGRSAENIGACDLFERCCVPGYCTKGGNHRHCKPDCPGANHFSNPQHDLPATAETRAKNRAASDLFGMGEVSAEEMNTYRQAEPDSSAPRFEPMALLGPYLSQLNSQSNNELREWRRTSGLPSPKDMNIEQAGQALIKIGQLIALQSSPQSPPAAGSAEEVPSQDPPPGTAPSADLISQAQAKRAHVIAGNLPDDIMRPIIWEGTARHPGEHGDSASYILRDLYEATCEALERAAKTGELPDGFDQVQEAWSNWRDEMEADKRAKAALDQYDADLEGAR